jgi:hypothetical protein
LPADDGNDSLLYAKNRKRKVISFLFPCKLDLFKAASKFGWQLARGSESFLGHPHWKISDQRNTHGKVVGQVPNSQSENHFDFTRTLPISMPSSRPSFFAAFSPE